MALFNELLGSARRRWNRAAARLFGMDEQEGVATLQPELQAVVLLESERLDYWHLKGGNLGSARSVDALDAANISHVGLSNPAGSNYLLEVEAIWPETASIFATLAANPTFDTTASGVMRDTRRPAITGQIDGTVGRAVVITNAAALGTIIAQIGTGIERKNFECILAPGMCLLLSPRIVNTAVTATIWWRERPVAPGELVI